MIQFQFNSLNGDNAENIAKSVKRLCGDSIPVIVCIGSDLVVGDAVIINAYEKNLNAADDSPLKVEQIQLATQRLEQPDKEE